MLHSKIPPTLAVTLLGSREKRQSLCLGAILLACAVSNQQQVTEPAATRKDLSKERACLSFTYISAKMKTRPKNQSCLRPSPAVHDQSTLNTVCYNDLLSREYFIKFLTAKESQSLDPTDILS